MSSQVPRELAGAQSRRRRDLRRRVLRRKRWIWRELLGERRPHHRPGFGIDLGLAFGDRYVR